MESDEWKAGFAAARHQAANLMGHFIVDETDSEDLRPAVALATKCHEAILAMTDNGTRPQQD